MKTLWILAAAATLAACANRGEDEVGAAPDRGDTTVTTSVDTTTGTWDTTSTGGVTAQPGDTALTPEAPADTTVGEYPAPAEPADTSSMGVDSGMGTDTTSMAPDTGAYVPDTSSAGVDTSTSTYDPSAATDTTSATDSAGVGHAPDNWSGDSAAVDHSVPDSTQ